MVFDWDDFSQANNRLDLLTALRRENPRFRCTLFAVPALGNDIFWDSVPDWCELAVHGWVHGDPATECADWSYERMAEVIANKPVRFVEGFKAPGWQISDGCFEALHDAGWWVADQPYNDHRRPRGLLTHRLGDGSHWHGHIQDIGTNGLAETWAELLPLVRDAERFELVSEAVAPWLG